MKLKYQILSLFFLVLFVFPQANKILHDIEHANDLHCQEKQTVHFHKYEHDCSLCDFQATHFTASASPEVVKAQQILFCSEYSLPVSKEKKEFFNRSYARGPPFLM